VELKINIFYTNEDPAIAAQEHCDKHVVKMILEYAQMLSTAHRILDGTLTLLVHPIHGRKKKHWLMPGEESYVNDEGKWKIRNGDEVTLFASASENHPCNIWVRASSENYTWLYDLFSNLLCEYNFRYGKNHSAAKLVAPLWTLPKNIPIREGTKPALAMPDEYKVDDAVTSYQNLYVGSKSRFARWTNRNPPEWFKQRIPDYNEADFVRTNRVAERAVDSGESLY
jgi:hypothetical protein